MSAESKIRGHLRSDRVPRDPYLQELWPLLKSYQITPSQNLKDEIRTTSADGAKKDSQGLKDLRGKMWAGSNYNLQVEYVGLLLKHLRLSNISLTGTELLEIYNDWLDPQRPPGPGPRLP